MSEMSIMLVFQYIISVTFEPYLKRNLSVPLVSYNHVIFYKDIDYINNDNDFEGKKRTI